MRFLKEVIADRSKLLVAYILISQLIFFFAEYYKYFPNMSFLLIDYRHSIDFPQFWDSNPPFYSILPFDTIICLIFKYLDFHRLNFLIIFLLVPYFHGMFSFTKICVLSSGILIRLFFLSLLSMPNLIGIFVGHFSVLSTIAVFYCFFGVLRDSRVMVFLSLLFIVCLKFNFMPLLLAPHLYQSKNIFRLNVVKTICFQFVLFFIIQVACFYAVSYLYPDYTLEKILNSFGAYSNDYVQGMGGFEFRYWLGTLSKVLVYIVGFSYQSGKIFVGLAYLIFTALAFMIYLRSNRLVITFVFVLLSLYLNLATTIYWYSLLLPFFIYFLSRRGEYGAETLLLTILLFPKPILFSSYVVYDNFFVFLSISFYLTWKVFTGDQSEAVACIPAGSALRN